MTKSAERKAINVLTNSPWTWIILFAIAFPATLVHRNWVGIATLIGDAFLIGCTGTRRWG